MKEKFLEIKFNNEAYDLILFMNKILLEFQKAGYRLSLRQLYYQLVARDKIPNTVNSYKRIGKPVSSARDAGLMDWEMIEDRNRETLIRPHWSSPRSIIQACAEQYFEDLWSDQQYHVEVVVEKDALTGVIQPVCHKYDVAFTANKGYSSSSMMYEMAKRIQTNIYNRGKASVVLYLGDHDPSGIDMTRDVHDRLVMYIFGEGVEPEEGEFKVERLALNMDQVRRWDPPENPAKTTDSRFASYSREFGDASWELDAVSPASLPVRERGLKLNYLDTKLFDARTKQVHDKRALISTVAERME